MKNVWVFGHNMPGYLPESEPDVCETWDEAKAIAIEYLDKEGDFFNDYEGDEGKTLAEECSAKMEQLNLDNGPEWGVIIGNSSIWITASVIEDDEWEEILESR